MIFLEALTYTSLCLDRNAIALARLDDLEEDLNLTSEQYQTCVSILFVGYLLGQIPSNMFLNRTRPSRYMGCCMMLWAVVSALTALSKDFTGLLLTRFFLGVTEAPYYPGAVYLLSMFYTRKEVATRIAILYTGNILATAFAGLIAAGIFHGLGDVAGITGWRWLFILQGAVTFVIAVVGFFLLPGKFSERLYEVHVRHILTSYLCRLHAQHMVAHTRRARPSHQPHGPRHRRQQGRDFRLGWFPPSGQGPHGLDLRFHGSHASCRQRVQELLPYRCPDAWV